MVAIRSPRAGSISPLSSRLAKSVRKVGKCLVSDSISDASYASAETVFLWMVAGSKSYKLCNRLSSLNFKRLNRSAMVDMIWLSFSVFVSFSVLDRLLNE